VAGATDVISANRRSGVDIDGALDNLVEGDLIGTDATGTISLGNAQSGVTISLYINLDENLLDSSSGNTIGGTVAGAADIISGNSDFGVEVDNSSQNVVEGDLIGTDVTGAIAVPNQMGGIEIDTSSNDNRIGGSTAAAGNLITDNGGPGVVVGNSV